MWEGELVAVEESGSPLLQGSVAMVAGQFQTDIGIGVSDADPAMERLGWVVRTGTCSGAGERIGPPSAFPAVLLTETGEGNGLGVVQRRIEEAPDYAAEVFTGADGSGELLACAEMERLRVN